MTLSSIFDTANRIRIVAAIGVLLASLAVAGLVLATPATGIPVGTAVATGDSTGDASPQFVVYGPTDGSAGDVMPFDSAAGRKRRVVETTPAGRITQGDEQFAGEVLVAVPMLAGAALASASSWSAVASSVSVSPTTSASAGSSISSPGGSGRSRRLTLASILDI